ELSPQRPADGSSSSRIRSAGIQASVSSSSASRYRTRPQRRSPRHSRGPLASVSRVTATPANSLAMIHRSTAGLLSDEERHGGKRVRAVDQDDLLVRQPDAVLGAAQPVGGAARPQDGAPLVM